MTPYGGLSAEHLEQFITRIERLEEEKKDISDSIKDVFAEAKSSGFDVKTMHEVIKLRKMAASDLEEKEYLLYTYKKALGMVSEEQ